MGSLFSQTEEVAIQTQTYQEETKVQTEPEQDYFSNNIYEKFFEPSSSYYDVCSSFSSKFEETCIICYESLSSSNKISLPCHSPFCLSCMSKYLETKINEIEVLRIPCPVPECLFEFSAETIRPLVSETLFNKYSKLLINEELSKNPYLKWCPTPDCAGYDIASSSKTQLKCNVCFNNFCFNCEENWKNHHKCKMPEKPLEYWFKKGVRYCPNCKRKVEKSSGCDHMTCVKCKYE